jgi:hypothetical protein
MPELLAIVIVVAVSAAATFALLFGLLWLVELLIGKPSR